MSILYSTAMAGFSLGDFSSSLPIPPSCFSVVWLKMQPACCNALALPCPATRHLKSALAVSAARELCLVMHKPAPNAIWLIEMLAFSVVAGMRFLASVPLDLVSFNFQAETPDYFIVKRMKVTSERSIFSHCELCDAKLWLSNFISGEHVSVNLWDYGPVPSRDTCIDWQFVQWKGRKVFGCQKAENSSCLGAFLYWLVRVVPCALYPCV